jgi:hypothetical protein
MTIPGMSMLSRTTVGSPASSVAGRVATAKLGILGNFLKRLCKTPFRAGRGVIEVERPPHAATMERIFNPRLYRP